MNIVNNCAWCLVFHVNAYNAIVILLFLYWIGFLRFSISHDITLLYEVHEMNNILLGCCVASTVHILLGKIVQLGCESNMRNLITDTWRSCGLQLLQMIRVDGIRIMVPLGQTMTVALSTVLPYFLPSKKGSCLSVLRMFMV